MIIAGLDTGTTSGLGIIRGSSLIHAETFRPPGDGDPAIFHGFRAWLRAALIAHEVEHVAVEEPLPTNLQGPAASNDDALPGLHGKGAKRPIGTMRTFLRLYGLRGHAIEVCYALNIPCVEISNKTWRSAVYGPCKPPKGTKNRSEWWKQKALERCRLLKIEVKGKDAAEAICIAQWLQGELRMGEIARPGELFNQQRGAA